MIQTQQHDKSQRSKFFILLAISYVTVLLMTMVVEDRVVEIGSIKILSGTLVLPLSYAISDIITEVYGYKQMRQLIWNSIIVLYAVAVMVFVIMSLPTDPKDSGNAAYNIVFHPFQRDIFTYSIAAVLSTFLNSFLLSKWKLLMRGRIFWLRSLGSTAVGEAVFILTWGFLGFLGKFGLPTLLELILVSYLCKIIYNIVTIVPTAVIVSFLKNAEGVDVYDISINYNPFIYQLK